MKIAAIVLVLCVPYMGTVANAAGLCEISDSNGSFSELQQVIRNPDCNVKSINDLIPLLPLKMRNRADLFYQSQSLQGPHKVDYLHPRAILRTAFSGAKQLYVTFNGNPKDAGYRELEVLDVNQKTPDNVFKYYAIQFPEDKDSKSLSWNDAQEQIQISAPNSSRCTACHGTPARPIYPTYPFWPGSFGSKSSTTDPNEKTQFERFIIEKNSDPNSRYASILKPGEHDQGGDFGMFGQLLMGHGHSDAELSKANSTRIAAIAKKMPQYDQFKFAIVGALLNCSDYESFFPASINASLKTRLKKDLSIEPRMDSTKIHSQLKEFWQAGDSQFGSTMGFKFTDSPYPGFVSGKPVSYTEFFSSVVKYWSRSGFLIDLFTVTQKAEGINHIVPIATKLRYVMEGRGLNISNWFLDLKQPTYRMMVGIDGGEHVAQAFVDEDSRISQLEGIGPLLYKGSSSEIQDSKIGVCNQLRSMSNEALAQQAVDQTTRLVEKPTSYPQTFLNTCTLCHVEQPIGPRIPFNDPALFGNWLRTGHHAELISYRLNGPLEQRMPLNRVLTDSEREELTKYINQNRN